MTARRSERAAAGSVLAGIGPQAALVRRSASSNPEMPRHMPAHSRRLPRAGTTPSRPASRASGTTARYSRWSPPHKMGLLGAVSTSRVLVFAYSRLLVLFRDRAIRFVARAAEEILSAPIRTQGVACDKPKRAL